LLTRRLRPRDISPDTAALILIVAAVLLANLPYLLDFVDPNPLGPRSGLVAAIVPGHTIGTATIDPNNGFVSQALSHRAMLDLVHLKLPWWNPFEGTGTPLAGELQSAALFPPTLLTLLSNGQLYEHILLELVAGISTYLLLRRIGLRRWPSVAGGVAFALNGTFAWYSHATVNPVAFLPMLLLGVELAYRAASDGRRGGWWLIAIAGALSFYAGFPEVAYIDTVLAILWFAWRCGCVERVRRRALIAKGIAGSLTGVLLSAPLLVAGLDYIVRADLGPHSTSIYGSTHLATQGLPQLLLPYVYGPIFAFADPHLTLTATWGSVGGYFTTALVLLAILGLLSPGRGALRGVLGLWIVLALSRVYGLPALEDVLGLLPQMSRVVFFRYANASVELALVVLAAFGVEDLLQRPERRSRVLMAAMATLVLIAAAGLGAHEFGKQLGPRYQHDHFFELALLWGIGTVIATVVALIAPAGRWRGPLVALIVAVDAIALFAVPELAAPRAIQLDTAPVAFLQRHLKTERVFGLGPLAPNYGSYFGIASLNINDIPIPSNFRAYIHEHLDRYVDPTVFVGNAGARSAFLPPAQQELLRNLADYRAAGVRYVLAPAGQALPERPGGLSLVFRSPSTWIYRLAGTAPLFSAAGAGCSVRTESTETARVSCPAASTLVRRETYARGWSASIDGHDAPVRSAGGLFQSVAVPAGTHRVQFSFSPPYIGWGGLAFVVGLAGLGLGVLAGRSRR
jgi:hypothetical protein